MCIAFIFVFFLNKNLSAQTDALKYDTLSYWHQMPTPKLRHSEHPYLYFNKNDINNLHQRILHPEITPAWKQLCNDALNKESHKGQLVNSVLPGCITFQISGDTSYARPAIEILMQHLKSDYNWTKPPDYISDLKYMNLSVPHFAYSIAFAYDMLYDVMTEAERATCLRALRENIFPDFIKAHARWDSVKHKFYDPEGHSDWWTNCYFGWNSKINGSVGLAALATLEDIPESELVLKMARKSLKQTHYEFNQYEIEDGGYDEGVHGWFSHMTYLIRFYAALDNALGQDDGFFILPGVIHSMNFAMDFVTNHYYYIPFGIGSHHPVNNAYSELYYLGKKYNSRQFIDFIDNCQRSFQLQPFAPLWRPLLFDEVPERKRPKISWYKDIDWGILNDRRLFVPFKAGDNAANGNQHDAGNLLIWLGGVYMLHSPGWGEMNTSDHNCITINGQNQLSGKPRKHDLGNFSDVFCPVERCETITKNHYVLMDLTPAYAGAVRYHRHIMITEQGTVIVIDDVVADKPSQFTVNWHTLLNLAAVNDSVYQITTHNRGLNIQTVSNRKLLFKKQCKNGEKQLVVKTDKSENSAKIITMFSPFAIRSPRLSCDFTQNMMVIKISVKNKQKEYIFFYEAGRYEFLRDYRPD